MDEKARNTLIADCAHRRGVALSLCANARARVQKPWATGVEGLGELCDALDEVRSIDSAVTLRRELIAWLGTLCEDSRDRSLEQRLDAENARSDRAVDAASELIDRCRVAERVSTVRHGPFAKLRALCAETSTSTTNAARKRRTSRSRSCGKGLQ